MSTPEAEETPELIQIPVVESPKEETAEIEPLVPAALNAPKVEEEVSKPDSSLQELIPGLYIAFSNDGPEGEQPGDSSEKPYTHIVNITHPTHDVDQNFKGSAHESYDHSLRRLHLVLAQSSSRMNKAQRTGLALSELQLRSVRDFLALALPPSLASSTDQSTVKVLITTPHGRPTDAMSAAACYLAFTSGQNVDTILRFVDEEEDFLSVWKGEVSEDEVEKIEKVVRSPSS